MWDLFFPPFFFRDTESLSNNIYPFKIYQPTHLFHQTRKAVNHTELHCNRETMTNGLYSYLQSAIVRIRKYKLFLSIEDVNIKDVTNKKWKMQMRVGYHGKKWSKSLILIWAQCSTSFLEALLSLQKNAFRKHGIHEMIGQRNPIWPYHHQLASQITCLDEGYKNRSQQHSQCFHHQTEDKKKINYKQKGAMNNQSQNGIQNICEKLQRKTWNRSEAADGSTDWKQVKMGAS